MNLPLARGFCCYLVLKCHLLSKYPHTQREDTPLAFKARSHRQNFAGAFLERYEEGPNFGNARHRAQNGEKNRQHGRCQSGAPLKPALV